MRIVSILAFLLASATFIRLFLLDKKYGKIIIDKKNNGFDSYGSFTEGYNLVIFNIDLSIIKSDIFEVEFIGIKSNDISFKKTFVNKISIDENFNLRIISNKKIKIKILYKDEFNNQYIQKLNLTPFKVKNNKIIKSLKMTISKRKWLCFNSIKKYFS